MSLADAHPKCSRGERNSGRSRELTRPLSKVVDHEHRRSRARPPTRSDGGQGGRAPSAPPRRSGQDGSPQPVLGGDARALHGRRLLSHAAAEDVRRLRVRTADLLSNDHRDRPRLPVDRLDAVPRCRPCIAGRVVIQPSGPGRDLRAGRALPGTAQRRQLSRLPISATRRRRVSDHREVALRVRGAVLDPLHGARRSWKAPTRPTSA